MKQARPALFDAKPIAAVPPATTGKVEEAAPAAAPTVNAKAKKATLKTSLYLDPAVHDVLREIAFQERKKVHDLVVEGVEQVLKNRRHPTIAEIAGKN